MGEYNDYIACIDWLTVWISKIVFVVLYPIASIIVGLAKGIKRVVLEAMDSYKYL